MNHFVMDVADVIEEAAADNKSKISEWLDKSLDWIAAKGVLLLLTLLFLFIGGKLIKLVIKILKKTFERRKISQSVAGFLTSFVRILLYA